MAGSGGDPRSAAQRAMTQAVRRTPGPAQQTQSFGRRWRPDCCQSGRAQRDVPSYGGGGRSGRWMRRGNRIVLLGV